MALWVTENELLRFLIASKILTNPPDNIGGMLDLNTALGTAQELFEQLSGYIPFLGATQSRVFSPQGPQRSSGGYASGNLMGGSRRLFLGGGLLTLGSLAIEVTSLIPSGRLLVLNTDFWLRPQNAPDFKRPYTFIEFSNSQYGRPDSIVIVGLWGFALTLPDGVKQAVLAKAAALLIPQIRLQLGGLIRYREGDEEVQVGSSTGRTVYDASLDAWESQFDSVVQRYRRVGMQ